MENETQTRLEYLRGQLRGECISYGELAELESLAGAIEPGDVELLEAAGVPEEKTERVLAHPSALTRDHKVAAPEDMPMILTDGWDSFDPWGSAMSIAFDVAEALVVLDADVPDEWHYHASPFVKAYEEGDVLEEGVEDIIAWVREGLITIEELRTGGDLAIRAAAELEAAGRSY